MKKLEQLLLITFLGFCSFKNSDNNSIQFSYPKLNNTTLIAETDLNFKFTKEWRGSDYYYYGETKDGIICSVLYYKLNEEEHLSFVEAPKAAFGTTYGPTFPYAYFSTNSNLKKYETDEESWDEPTQKFMYRICSITEFEGIKTKQKHMYAYCMFNKDLFVNIHLSKTNYTSADSIVMRQLLVNFKPKN